MFLVSNPKKSGQYYYDKRTGILYKCHFKRPVPGKEIAPFSWVLLISSLAFIILAPAYFTYQHISLLHISLLLNLSFFVLELCLAHFYMKRIRMQIERDGTALVLRNLNIEELKALKRDFLRGIVIYSGLYYTFFCGMVFILFLNAVIFFYGKQYIISLTFLLYAIEFWGYDFYFTRRKYQKDVLEEIDSLLRNQENMHGTGDGSLPQDENSK